MDFAALIARIDAACTWVEEDAGARFTVRRPTVDGFREWCKPHRSADGASVDFYAVAVDHAAGAIVGWSGVTLRHFGLDDDTAVEYSPAAARRLLADAPALRERLWTALMKRINERLIAEDADQKNSSSVSAPA
jgi:hypothetical protein